ncbi:MAG: CoA-binding protein [Actinobacteria bacterium]|nr:CoA-binding protein [Actinomycetota bacterium]
MDTIDAFFQYHHYATVGIEPTSTYGAFLLGKLRGAGREVDVVVDGGTGLERAYRSLREVPLPLDGVIFNIEKDPDRLLRDVEVAVALGVPRIWIENRCSAAAAVAYARAHGVEVVDNACVLPGAWVGNRAGAVIAGAWDSWACIEQAG